MDELALFAGGGGGILGGKLLGWRTRCAVEIDSCARSILLARQRDGILDQFPIWDDIKTFDGKQWRGAIDVVSGGFPCQDISCAGKGGGLTGERSGLWFEMLRVVDEVKPRFVFAENSPNLRTLGLGTVLEGLASLGYDARWCVLGAWHVGAPHQRNRMWIVAYNNSRVQYVKSVNDKMACTSAIGQTVPDSDSERLRDELRGLIWERAAEEAALFADDGQKRNAPDSDSDRRDQGRERNGSEQEARRPTPWWAVEPDVERVVYRLPHRVDRIKALGNAQVPLVAATAWRILTHDLRTD